MTFNQIGEDCLRMLCPAHAVSMEPRTFPVHAAILRSKICPLKATNIIQLTAVMYQHTKGKSTQ